MQINSFAPRASATQSPAPSPRPAGSQALEDVFTFTGCAATTAGLAAFSAVMAPEGAGFKHVVQTLSFGAVAAVGGAMVGAYAGERIGHMAEKYAGTSHSADERMGSTLMGGLTGGIAGAGAGLASGFFGVSPVAAAVTAGGVVVGLGVLAAVMDASSR